MKRFKIMDLQPYPRPTDFESLVGEIWMFVFKEAKTTDDSDVNPGLGTTIYLGLFLLLSLLLLLLI